MHLHAEATIDFGWLLGSNPTSPVMIKFRKLLLVFPEASTMFKAVEKTRKLGERNYVDSRRTYHQI